MLGQWAMWLTIALFTLVDGKHRTPSAVQPRVPAIQHQYANRTNAALLAAPINTKVLAQTRIVGSLAQKDIPVTKHKKKPGKGYDKGSPLYDKQQKQKKSEPLPLPPTGRHK